MKATFSLVFALALVAGGCSTPRHEVRVDAINAPTPASKDYSRLTGGTGTNSLLDAEVAAQVRTELAGRGFRETSVPAPGVLTLSYDYGLRAPRNVARRFSEPLYGWDFDTSDVVVTQTPAPGGGFTTTTHRVSRPPSMRVIGYNEGSVSVSVVDKFLTVSASNEKGQVWSVTAVSSGENDDIRRVLPILARAVADKAGENTGGQVILSYKPEEFK